MVIQVEGFNLPGIRCNPGPDAAPNENVHVGIGLRGEAVELFPGDADAATWRFEVRPVEVGDGSLDYRGPMVSGPRGDRFLYLNWVAVGENGAARLFRRAKIDLTALDPSLVRSALERGRDLVCRVDLTDSKGNPACARLKGPAISWRVDG